MKQRPFILHLKNDDSGLIPVITTISNNDESAAIEAYARLNTPIEQKLEAVKTSLPVSAKHGLADHMKLEWLSNELYLEYDEPHKYGVKVCNLTDAELHACVLLGAEQQDPAVWYLAVLELKRRADLKISRAKSKATLLEREAKRKLYVERLISAKKREGKQAAPIPIEHTPQIQPNAPSFSV